MDGSIYVNIFSRLFFNNFDDLASPDYTGFKMSFASSVLKDLRTEESLRV